MERKLAAPVCVLSETRDDGTVILENGLPLPSVEGTIPARLKHWAAQTPNALFLTQQDRALTYGQAEQKRRLLAERLMTCCQGDGAPLMIVADNGINHALAMLAATSVGIPVAVVSAAYVAPAAMPWAKFCRILDQIEPQLIIADNPDAVRDALSESTIQPNVQSLADLSWLENVAPTNAAMVDAAEQSVTLDTVAKLLFTSGSTGAPKAVPNTQRMMVSNMLGLSVVWPFLLERPPVSVDWLPWNHTFGGNCCFNTTLWFGGHSHIDSGRPSPAAIGQSVEAIKRFKPNLYYNVPIGFETLLPILEVDDAFASEFFCNLDFVFNAGAPLPGPLRARLEAVAERLTGKRPWIVAGWGSTETAPFSTILYFEQPHASNLGAPIPGTQIKMVPLDERFELRVKGPNVMPGYWRDEAATANVFDEEGFYKIGDAARFADPADSSAGILFDGRVAENFKLLSGTWVNVGALRLAVIAASGNLISDAVVTGEGRGDIGLLIFLNEGVCRETLATDVGSLSVDQPLSAHPTIRSLIHERLQVYNTTQMGSSTRIARFEILSEPPSAAHDEITDKGYVNQRKVLSRRLDIVEALYLTKSIL